MEEQLRMDLQEGEQLLWSGRPEPFDTLDRTNRPGILRGLAVKALATLCILILYIAAVRGTGELRLSMVAIILVFGAYALAYPFLTARHLRRKTFYGFTDRRVIRSGMRKESIPYERIRRAALRKDEDGHTSLLCGTESVNLPPRKWRNEADTLFNNDSDEPEISRMVFYALPVDDALRALLDKYLPLQ